MKTIIAGLMLIISMGAQAQKTKAFSLSPMTKDIERVNGLVVGIGHFQKPPYIQTINGVNIDVMPLSPLVSFLAIMYGGAFRYNEDDTRRLVSNGLNLGVGGYMGGVEHNGLSIALYNAGYAANGVGIHGTFNVVTYLKGVHISGISNVAGISSGVNIALYNDSGTMSGLQLGLVNSSTKIRGLQIGLFNRTGELKGLQLGLINQNRKRIFPFINF